MEHRKVIVVYPEVTNCSFNVMMDDEEREESHLSSHEITNSGNVERVRLEGEDRYF